MKILISLLLTFFLFSVVAQDTNPSNVYLSLNKKKINSSDYVNIYDLKNIEIEATDTIDYQLQFVIVPFEGDWLSFTKNQTQIKSMNIDGLLQLGKISIENIKQISLQIKKDERAEVLYSATVFTRDLKVAEDYYKEFTLFAKIGDGETSIWCINEAIKLDSTNLKYLNAAAQLYLEMGEISRAKEAYLKISTSQPNYISFAYLSIICLKEGDYSGAKSFAEKNLKYATNDNEKSEVYLAIADANSKLFDFKEAYNNYKKSIKFNPKNINALNNITTVLDEVNKSAEKVEYFNQILKVDSSFYLVHINIGFYYIEKQQFELALKEFNDVLEIEPNQAIALSNKAFVLLKLGKKEEALVNIDKSLESEPKNSYAYRNKALILIEMGDINAACLALEDAIKLNFTQQYGDEVLTLNKKNCGK